MQDTRSEAAYHSTKLCFLILTCVSEDEYANSLMHDPGLTFRVPLHRLPMRHRKSLTDKTPPFRPLVCGLLGINVVCFFVGSMSDFKIPVYIFHYRLDHRVHSESSDEKVSTRTLRVGARCCVACLVPSEALPLAFVAVPVERAVGSADCFAQVSPRQRLYVNPQV